MLINKDILKNELDEFLGSRTLTTELEEFLVSLKSPLECVLYRGMNFPIHLLEKGEKLEEWHGSSHWSKELKVAHNFAYDGYVNEDYVNEIGENKTLLQQYKVNDACDLFTEVVFRLKENKQAINVDKLVIEWGLANWAHEKEVTFIGTDFLITNIIHIKDEENPYFLVDVEEI
ncbi:hypothetical protein [Bacillus thuringiensis]|uniref:hypothetical protein n=1 Tax=Bacillus thuringiensis TaxID=1428 RepID=UPI0021D667C0|nr:hypothetical protein [Bacillus thuringiensis]MCU7667555.1 hypothetical protein [Bacillus thuringiensis]